MQSHMQRVGTTASHRPVARSHLDTHSRRSGSRRPASAAAPGESRVGESGRHELLLGFLEVLWGRSVTQCPCPSANVRSWR